MDSEFKPDGIIKMIEKVETPKLKYFLDKIKNKIKCSDDEGKKYLLSLRRLIENELYSRNDHEESSNFKYGEEDNSELESWVSYVKIIEDKKIDIPKRGWWDRKNSL